MSTGGNLTLSRLLRTEGAVTNPFFRHISDGVIWPLPDRKNNNIFRDAPGWYMFGAHPQTRLQSPDSADNADNPFAPSGAANAGSGITITHRGDFYASSYTHPGGLCQRLSNGKALLGKKVRVSGSYRVRQNDSVLPSGAGMSIWLKGKVRSMPVDPNYASGTGTTAGSTITDGALPGSIVAGDFLAVEEQSFSSTLDASFYQVASTAAGSLSIETGGGALTGIGGPLQYAVSRAADGEASFLGTRGIRLGSLNNVAGHVISWTDSGTYVSGEEWLTRAWDYLETPRYDTPSGPGFAAIGGRLLCFRTYESAPNTAFPVITSAGGTAEGNPLSDRYLQGEHPAASTIFYLDADDWTDNPADGNINLLDSLTSGVGVEFFEEIIELPDDATFITTYQDIFLVVMLLNPSEAATPSLSNIDVTFYSLNIEVIPDPDNGIEDRLVESFFAQDDPPGVGRNVRDIIQYPIYVPALYPLSVDWGMTLNFGSSPGSPVLNSNFIKDVGFVRFNYQARVNMLGLFGETTPPGGAPTDGPLYAKQAQLPPLSVVVEASFWIHNAADLWDEGPVDPGLFRMYGIQSVFTSVSVGDRQSEGTTIADLEGPSAIIAAATEQSLSLYRHRVGLFWPEVGGSTSPASLAEQGAWDSYFMFSRPGDIDLLNQNPVLEASGGYILCLVDPRTDALFWSRG